MLSQRKMLDSFGDQNLFIFPAQKRTWSKRSRLSLRSLHTLASFWYHYYNGCVAFKTNSMCFLKTV